MSRGYRGPNTTPLGQLAGTSSQSSGPAGGGTTAFLALLDEGIGPEARFCSAEAATTNPLAIPHVSNAAFPHVPLQTLLGNVGHLGIKPNFHPVSPPRTGVGLGGAATHHQLIEVPCYPQYPQKKEPLAAPSQHGDKKRLGLRTQP